MRVPLTGGFYQARGLLANAQSCINLYPEKNPESSQPPSPVTHYLTPGLDLKVTASENIVRGTYRTSQGELYVVVGNKLYFVSASFTLTSIGSLNGNLTTPVSMADNGTSMVIVDGSANGYQVTLNTRSFSMITDPNFFGADRVDYLDTFFLFNYPGTSNFYISLSDQVSFDPLDIAGKVGYPDPLVSIIVMHREIWLIGELTCEVWYNSGAADFTFQQMPGAFIEHGCVAKYSVAAQDLSVYWLSQDKQGQAMVLKGGGYKASRISTHSIEQVFSKYSTISDAIGFTYQEQGHVFYVLTFPTANATWVYDEASELWHQRVWTDTQGNFNRHRANCMANAYGFNIVGDWQNGNIYAFNTETYTDNAQPISRVRAFPHMIKDSNRITYNSFIADMDVGMDTGSVDGSTPSSPPEVYLRWSDNKGKTFGNRVAQSLGAAGQYNTTIQWGRLGLGRDRVFELSWSSPAATALNGCFLEDDECAS